MTIEESFKIGVCVKITCLGLPYCTLGKIEKVDRDVMSLRLIDNELLVCKVHDYSFSVIDENEYEICRILYS